jgi:tRNA-dihydrouridine synthase
MATQTGCDAVMIGRTAPSNPWIFRQIEQYCSALRKASTGNAVGSRPEQHRSGVWPEGQLGAAVPTWAVPETRALARSYDEPSETDRYQMIRTYFQMLIEEELPDAVGKMKQFASWFTHGVPGGAALRKGIYESKSAPEILGRVEEFFEARLCGAGTLAREM